LLGLVLGASGGTIWLPERPTDYVSSRAIAIPIPPPTKPRPDPDLARGFAELDCRDIGQGDAKAAARRPDAAGEVDFLEHCFIAKCVLIGSSNYFATGPKRSTSSFHEAMILAFVFRAL
jgi:hypothetical protein